MARITRRERSAYRLGYCQAMTRAEYIAEHGGDGLAAYELGTVDGMVYMDFVNRGGSPELALQCTVNRAYWGRA